MRPSPHSFRSHFSRGLDDIEVVLYPTIDPQEAANTIASFYLSTWDDPVDPESWNESKIMQDLAWRHAQEACSGKVLPNTLESIPLTFSINGLSRATTHQLVRSRVGAVFGQQGGRDNNWSDFNTRMPETWYNYGGPNLVAKWQDILDAQDELYKEALGAGIPFQDARYCLPMGLETALVASYNLLSFKGLAERRLCNRMMWETNYIVRKMSDLVVEAYPFMGKNLRSSCEKRGVCASVSPMFPPSCFYYHEHSTEMCKDNPTLENMVKDNGYDWPLRANGSWLHFWNIDDKRLRGEHFRPTSVMSLLNPQQTLAIQEVGLWRKF